MINNLFSIKINNQKFSIRQLKRATIRLLQKLSEKSITLKIKTSITILIIQIEAARPTTPDRIFPMDPISKKEMIIVKNGLIVYQVRIFLKNKLSVNSRLEISPSVKRIWRKHYGELLFLCLILIHHIFILKHFYFIGSDSEEEFGFDGERPRITDMRKNSPSRNKKSRRSDLDQSRNRGPHRGAPPGRVFDDRRPKDSEFFFDVFFW